MRETAMFRQVQLKIPLRDGVYEGELLTAYNTVSGNFWWVLRGGDLPIHNLAPADWFASHVCLVQLENRLLAFWADVATVWVLERDDLHASSIEEAQNRALENLRRRIHEKGEDAPGLARHLWDGKEIRLHHPFPASFFLPQGASMAKWGTTEVLSADKEGSNWRIVMRNQWEQELILDESYAFVSTRRLDTVPPDQK